MKKLSDFKPLEKNPNRHTSHGMGLLEKSIETVGYVTPMTAAADGTIIDGNARFEQVGQQLPEDPIIIHHDGKRPIIAVRDDIKDGDSKEAREIAVLANRTAEKNLDWDTKLLSEMNLEGFDLEDVGFDLDESEELLKEKEELLKPYKKVHVLVSVDIDKIHSIGSLIDQLRAIEGVEIETQAN